MQLKILKSALGHNVQIFYAWAPLINVTSIILLKFWTSNATSLYKQILVLLIALVHVYVEWLLY
jgi:hypothetical protein